MSKEVTAGHALALFTILIWGSTFISTKMLLDDFSPVEILFIRFLIGFLALCVMCPRVLHLEDRRQEIYFILAGLTGICLSYMLENTALLYTMSSNIAVIVAMSPFFTAMIMHIFFRGEEKLRGWFFLGFAVSIVGVALISFNGAELKFNPLGDLIAIASSLLWAVYCVLVKKISSFGYGEMQITRRTFAYGLIFTVPFLFITGFDPDWSAFGEVSTIANYLFLGLGASAICFSTWAYSTKVLGAVGVGVYLYLMPVVTMIVSSIFLGEPVTVMSVTGVALTLSGLAIYEYGDRIRTADP